MAGFDPLIGSETYSYEATLALVGSGAVALVAELATPMALAGVRFFIPADVSPERSVFAAVRQGSSRRPDLVVAVKALLAGQVPPRKMRSRFDAEDSA